MLAVTNLIGFGARRLVAAAATPVVWNSADKTASLALSDGDRTGTSSAGSQGARGTISKSSGKWYFELVTNGAWGGAAGTYNAGLATSGFSLGGQLGAASTGLAFNNSASNARYNNSAVTVNPDPGGWTTASAVAMIAVDLDAQYFWFGINGTWGGLSGVAGNPGAGTTPVLTAFGTGPWFPCITNGNSGDACTISASAAHCTYTPPSGFSYWSA